MKIRHNPPVSRRNSNPSPSKPKDCQPIKKAVAHEDTISKFSRVQQNTSAHIGRKSGIVSAKNPYQEPDVYLTRPPKKSNRKYTGRPGGPGDPEPADKPPLGTKEREIIDQRVALIRNHSSPILNANSPIILPAKIFEYTLSSDHSYGGPKSKIFEKVGYVIRPSSVNWEDDREFRESGKLLSVTLGKALLKYPGTFVADTLRGVKYMVMMNIETPKGITVLVETAWTYKVKTNKTIDLRPSLTSARIYSRSQEERYRKEQKR